MVAIDLTQNAVIDVTARRWEASEIDDYDFLESELFRSTIMSVFPTDSIKSPSRNRLRLAL